MCCSFKVVTRYLWIFVFNYSGTVTRSVIELLLNVTLYVYCIIHITYGTKSPYTCLMRCSCRKLDGSYTKYYTEYC